MDFSSTTIARGWEESIEYLLKNGNVVDSQRGMRTLEITNAVFRISHPLSEPKVSPKYSYSSDFISGFLSDMEDIHEGVSIGNRIYNYGETRINQFERIIDELKNDHFSRRAVLNLWAPDQDSTSEHPPCAVTLQLYVRDGLLHMTSFMRSVDAWMLAIPDMLAFTKFQENVGGRLQIRVGTFTQIAVSYHIYEKDLLKARGTFMPS